MKYFPCSGPPFIKLSRENYNLMTFKNFIQFKTEIESIITCMSILLLSHILTLNYHHASRISTLFHYEDMNFSKGIDE